MFVTLDKTGSLERLAQLLEIVQQHPGVTSILVLAADANEFVPATLDPVLRQVNVPVAGGIFPAIVHQGQHYARGTLVIGLAARTRTRVIRDLSTTNPAGLARLFAAVDDRDFCLDRGTAFFWADGFAPQLSALMDAFHCHACLNYAVIGGAAGSLDLVQKPCIITNAGLLADAAVITVVDASSSVAARHGWVKLSGPFLVTRATGNVVHTLNARPALEVYQAAISDAYGKAIVLDRFYEAAQNFPFGIQRYGAERIVRDPVRVEGTKLICIGDVPQGALVDILTATTTSLLVAVDEVMLEAEAQARRFGQVRTVFVVDCVSRMVLLQGQFQRELVNLYLPGTVTVGVLALGEFACNGRDAPAFLCKSTVVAMFPALA